MTTQRIPQTNYHPAEDIRDVEPGEVYFALADPDRGGRCVNSGMFTAIWRTRQAAKRARRDDRLVVVKCQKPAGADVPENQRPLTIDQAQQLVIEAGYAVGVGFETERLVYAASMRTVPGTLGHPCFEVTWNKEIERRHING